MIFSDEAYFYLTLPNNKQNNRYWSDSAQEYGIEKPLKDKKVLVWCAISSVRVFGPYFFESTVNSTNYLEMIRTFFIPRVKKSRDYEKSYGATPLCELSSHKLCELCLGELRVFNYLFQFTYILSKYIGELAIRELSLTLISVLINDCILKTINLSNKPIFQSINF